MIDLSINKLILTLEVTMNCLDICKMYNVKSLSCADLRGANLSCANLRAANLSCANLRGADLSRADLSYADLSGADLSGANLRGANLSCANLRGANLSCANLRAANLSCANLRGADLRDADLRGVDLRDADLRRADLQGADLIVIYGERYFISICRGTVRAGCQSHTVEEWRSFSKAEVAGMDGRNSLKYYPRLLDIIDFYYGKEPRPGWLNEK